MPNAMDNCPDAGNPEQVDSDGDGQGDACDTDDDNDSILDADDNCPIVANMDQVDDDGDGRGTACDGDNDGDTVPDATDNCPLAGNTDQRDADGDGMGNACDEDDDNDSLLDMLDNCPRVANLDQADLDGDELGDVCDPDDDNDGRLDVIDNCPLAANPTQQNSDTDALGDACDPDDDNDTVDDTIDNCAIPNPTQENADSDSFGDACDNCPAVVNDQSNSDADTLGNACDPDDDNDGVDDTTDNCDLTPNADQADSDVDGIGDVCDDTLATSFEGHIVGGNIASVGASLSGRGNAAVQTTATLTVGNLPAGAVVVTARLYWVTIGQADPFVRLNGTSITGSVVGTTADTCWGIGENVIHRADVSSLVTRNGSYVMSDFLSATSGPDGQGASLVVVYRDPADTRLNFVGLSDGAIGFVGSGTISAQSTIGGFLAGASFDKVTVTNIVADGQEFDDSMAINGVAFGGANAFGGLSGLLWDNRIDDATATLTADSTASTTTLTSNNDCLAWAVHAVVVEDVAPPSAKHVRTPSGSKVLTRGAPGGVKAGGRIVR